MTYLAHMDENEAIRLAHAVLLLVSEHPAMIHRSPIAVLATVLQEPPWSLDWREAATFISEALREGVTA